MKQLTIQEVELWRDVRWYRYNDKALAYPVDNDGEFKCELCDRLADCFAVVGSRMFLEACARCLARTRDDLVDLVEEVDARQPT